MGSLGNQAVAQNPFHWPCLRLLMEVAMCLQKLVLKTLGSLRGRYPKVAWERQNWGLGERENPPCWGGAGSCWDSGSLDPDLVCHSLQCSCGMFFLLQTREVCSQSVALAWSECRRQKSKHPCELGPVGGPGLQTLSQACPGCGG